MAVPKRLRIAQDAPTAAQSPNHPPQRSASPEDKHENDLDADFGSVGDPDDELPDDKSERKVYNDERKRKSSDDKSEGKVSNNEREGNIANDESEGKTTDDETKANIR